MAFKQRLDMTANYYKNYHLMTIVLQNFDTNLKRLSWNGFGES